VRPARLLNLNFPLSKAQKGKIQMKRILVVVTVVLLAALAPSVLLAQSNPLIGTWKMNTAKSKYNPGPVPQSQTQTVEAQGDGVRVRSEGTAADGSHITWGYTANYDGKDNPVSGGTGVLNGADTVAVKRINPNTTENTFKKAGKVVLTGRDVVSKDGKVRTITAKGTDANGHAVSRVIVLDKQ
jgi:hypothetical protein